MVVIIIIIIVIIIIIIVIVITIIRESEYLIYLIKISQMLFQCKLITHW